MNRQTSMSHKTYLIEVREFLLKLIVAKLEERIRDDSVSIVLDDFLIEAIESVVKMNSVLEETEDNIQDMFDETVVECFGKIASFKNDPEFVHMFASKQFSEHVSGKQIIDMLNV
jgi:hypothetical protein